MRLVSSFMIGLFKCSHVFATDQCDDGATYIYYHFKSIGSCQAGNMLVSRRLNVDALQ